MECGNPEIFNFCISSTKVFISYTFQMLHLLQVKRFEQNIPISYIKFFYSLWEITNKDNILRGTVPWTFLEDAGTWLHCLWFEVIIHLPVFPTISWMLGENRPNFIPASFVTLETIWTVLCMKMYLQIFIKLKNAYHVLYQLYCSGNIYYIIYSL